MKYKKQIFYLSSWYTYFQLIHIIMKDDVM